MCRDLRVSTTGRVRYIEEEGPLETPCWVWQMTVAPNGYGELFSDGFHGNAHRFFYERLVGPVPDGAVLDHLCGVRRCVNPKHLETVRQAENVRRGRLAKLTQDDVDVIRGLFTSGLRNSQIALRFDVSAGCISDIRCGRRWAAQGGRVHAIA